MREPLLTLINDYSTTITLAVGLITIFGIVWRKVITPGLKMVSDTRDAFVGLRQLIEAQLAENGGGSMVDKVNLIQHNHETAETHWKTLEIAQAAMKTEVTTRLDSIDTRLGNSEARFALLEKL